jgi:hypothetical protein
MFDTSNSGFAEKLLWPVVDKLSVDTKYDTLVLGLIYQLMRNKSYKQLMPCDLIFSTFWRIFSRSAFSKSASLPVLSTYICL